MRSLNVITAVAIGIVIGMAALVLTGCGPSDEIQRITAIRAVFPGAEFWKTPVNDSAFLVRDTNGAVWYVELRWCRPHSISGKALIFPAPAVYKLEK